MVAVIATLLATAVFGGAAQAARAPGLPAPGQVFEVSLHSEGITLQVNGQTVQSGPLEGSLRLEVALNPDDPLGLSVLVQASGLQMTTVEVPGQAYATPKISVAQNMVDVDFASVLRLTSTLPLEFEQVLALSLTITIEDAGEAIGQEPMALTTQDTAGLTATLSAFPPKGDLYHLQNPVDLVDLNQQPESDVHRLERFPVSASAL